MRCQYPVRPSFGQIDDWFAQRVGIEDCRAHSLSQPAHQPILGTGTDAGSRDDRPTSRVVLSISDANYLWRNIHIARQLAMAFKTNH